MSASARAAAAALSDEALDAAYDEIMASDAPLTPEALAICAEFDAREAAAEKTIH